MSKLLELEEILASKIEARCPCIYFLINESEVVYVGQSIYLGSRIAAHAYGKVFTHYAYTPCPEYQLTELETEYIVKYSPFYNNVLPLQDKYLSLNQIKTRYDLNKTQIKKAMIKARVSPVCVLSNGNAYYRVSDLVKVL